MLGILFNIKNLRQETPVIKINNILTVTLFVNK